MEPAPLRWLYHATLREAWERARGAAAYTPVDAHGPGADFIHASYRGAILESARLYLPPGNAFVILRIDPRALLVAVEVAETPRGPMPHVHGEVPRDAIAEAYEEPGLSAAIDRAPDWIV